MIKLYSKINCGLGPSRSRTISAKSDTFINIIEQAPISTWNAALIHHGKRHNAYAFILETLVLFSGVLVDAR